jgi:lysozyme
MDIKPAVVDLSHWDPAFSYDDVLADGYSGCIYKATEGGNYTDPTYVGQQHATKAAGLLWGSYHFADGSSVSAQIDNFMNFACPDPDELFCLDWEDNGGDTMSMDDARTWITGVEQQLGRPGECVIYSGNTAKEALGDNVDSFFGGRRLWLCQYSTTPTWQRSWSEPWLWQFTDGQSGPSPHSVNGVGHCDINSYQESAEQLAAEWASGSSGPSPAPPPPPPSRQVVEVLIAAPAGITVKVRQLKLGLGRSLHDIRKSRQKEGQ